MIESLARLHSFEITEPTSNWEAAWEAPASYCSPSELPQVRRSIGLHSLLIASKERESSPACTYCISPHSHVSGALPPSGPLCVLAASS